MDGTSNPTRPTIFCYSVSQAYISLEVSESLDSNLSESASDSPRNRIVSEVKRNEYRRSGGIYRRLLSASDITPVRRLRQVHSERFDHRAWSAGTAHKKSSLIQDFRPSMAWKSGVLVLRHPRLVLEIPRSCPCRHSGLRPIIPIGRTSNRQA